MREAMRVFAIAAMLFCWVFGFLEHDVQLVTAAGVFYIGIAISYNKEDK